MHQSEISATADSFASKSGLDSEEYEEELRRKYQIRTGQVQPSVESQNKAAKLIQHQVITLMDWGLW